MRSSVAAFLILSLGLGAVGVAQAEGYRSRTGRWDFTLQMRYLDSQTMNFDGGTSIETNTEMGWGFGFGYNFNDHLALNFDFGWNSPSFDATIASADTPGTVRKASGEMNTSSIQMNLLYNFIAGPVTPFVGAGIGSTFVDTNIPSGLGSTSCWWDPWYGYICYDYQPTYSDSRFSYNALVGVRWDLSREVFLRAMLGTHWIDMPTGSDQDFTVGRFDIGFSY